MEHRNTGGSGRVGGVWVRAPRNRGAGKSWATECPPSCEITTVPHSGHGHKNRMQDGGRDEEHHAGQ